MSTFIEFIRAMQKTLLKLCSGSWRQLLVVVAAAVLVISLLIYAADLEPKFVLNEPVPEVLEVPAQEVPAPEEKFLSIPAMTNVPSVSEPEQSVHSEQAPALNADVCAPDGIAIGGYDLVSYYKADAPQSGVQTIYVEYLGLTYHFANIQNRAAFLAEPSKYLPSYRGWCSTNLSMGRLACPDYTNYKLENGSLLFFEQVGFTNGLDVWNSDPLLHRRQANQNFLLLST